jgi:hypothetical protein
MGTFTLDEDTGNTTPNQLPGPDVDNSSPPPASGTTWVFDATTIRSLDQSEMHSIPAGDELYLARVRFRSTVGKANSTTAYFNGGVSADTVIKGVQVNETHSIPDSMGKVTFPNVELRGVNDVLAGNNPEILGTIDVLFEDDTTPKDAICDLMRDLALAVKDELADIVEPLNLLNMNATAMAGQIQDAVQGIEDAVMPSTGELIGLFLSSFFNPDDLIGFRVNLFAAVDATLSSLVDSQVAGVISSSTGTAGSLRERSYSHTYSGSAGSWRVSHSITS